MTPEILRRTSDPARHEKLDRLKKWPSLRKRWEGKQVRIWSDQWEAYWRPKGAGYTLDTADSGTFSFEGAFMATRHCGPEKRIQFKLVEDGKE